MEAHAPSVGSSKAAEAANEDPFIHWESDVSENEGLASGIAPECVMTEAELPAELASTASEDEGGHRPLDVVPRRLELHKSDVRVGFEGDRLPDAGGDTDSDASVQEDSGSDFVDEGSPLPESSHSSDDAESGSDFEEPRRKRRRTVQKARSLPKFHKLPHETSGPEGVSSAPAEQMSARPAVQTLPTPPATPATVRTTKPRTRETPRAGDGCKHPGCRYYRLYGDPQEAKKLFCVEHKRPTDVPIYRKSLSECSRAGCTAIGPYVALDGSGPAYCRKHRPDNTTHVSNLKKLCKTPGCTSRADYGNDDKPVACIAHMEKGMASYRRTHRRTCAHEGCPTIPNYNFPGVKPPLFCARHAKVGMVHLRKDHCQHPGCLIKPYYDFLGATKGKFCKAHAEPDMIDVMSRLCEHPGCVKAAWWGPPGKRVKGLKGSAKRVRCGEYKLPGMVDCTRPVPHNEESE